MVTVLPREHLRENYFITEKLNDYNSDYHYYIVMLLNYIELLYYIGTPVLHQNTQLQEC